MTIAEAAARCGLPESTLRYWERIGLVNRVRRGDEAAGEQRELFETHARRVADEVAALELRRHYLDLKVRYWSAREAGDLDKAAAVAEELGPIIRRMNPKDNA